MRDSNPRPLTARTVLGRPVATGDLPALRLLPDFFRRRPEAGVVLLLAALLAGCGAGPVPIKVEPIIMGLSDFSPSWSPAGAHIAYVHDVSNTNHGVWLVDTAGIAGVAPHEIVSGSWQDLDWSPDGTHLALVNNSDYGIYSVDLNSGGPHAFIAAGTAPRWSPDGNYIAFQMIDTAGVGSIGLVSKNGGAVRVLAPPDTESWSAPDWSPDGLHLVHVRIIPRGGSANLFVMDTTGHAEVRLTTGGGDRIEPAWSPNGQWIAWSLGTFSPSNELWVMKANGAEARMLTYGGHPSWSPDSRQVVFGHLEFNVVRLAAIDIATLRVHEITR